MSILNEIARISNGKDDIIGVLQERGVSVPTDTPIEELPPYVSSMNVVGIDDGGVFYGGANAVLSSDSGGIYADGLERNILDFSKSEDWFLKGIDTDGSLYNGKGYIEGYRLNSSGSLTEQTGTYASGFIPASGLLSDLEMIAAIGAYTISYVYYYNESFQSMGYTSVWQYGDSNACDLRLISPCWHATHYNNTYKAAQVKYIRLSFTSTAYSNGLPSIKKIKLGGKVTV